METRVWNNPAPMSEKGEKQQPCSGLLMLAYSRNYAAYEAYATYELIRSVKPTRLMSPSFGRMGLLIRE